MDERAAPTETDDLAGKIARLVEERGWNQEEFARIARVNRHTARQILLSRGGGRRLRNATVGACARALGLPVSDLRGLPLERLLPRMRDAQPADGDDARRHAARVTHPELVAWLERHPDRAARLSAGEWEELLALQDGGGPLTALGVEAFARRLERRRRVVEQVVALAGSEHFDLLEQLVALLYEKLPAAHGPR